MRLIGLLYNGNGYLCFKHAVENPENVEIEVDVEGNPTCYLCDQDNRGEVCGNLLTDNTCFPCINRLTKEWIAKNKF